MTAQVVLLIGGLVFLGIGILGSGNYVKIVIPPMRTWARISFALLGCAVFALAFIIPGTLIRSSGQALPSLGATPSDNLGKSSPTVTQTPSVRITSPVRGDIISKDTTVLMRGTAIGNLNGRSLWIFVWSSGAYYVNNASPITISRGDWRFDDPYIGSGGVGAYVIDAVLANSSCVTAIQSAKAQPGGGIVFRILPQGCAVGSNVPVTVPS
jgi:hypothetical protein